MVAVDETKIKADGEWCYVWAAIDVDTRELLMGFMEEEYPQR
jgi:transposase-like protein